MTGSIAETIQGEAGSDPVAQFAVASTIFNRTQSPLFPSDPLAVVNQPQQFVGFSATPNANAQALAQAVQDGSITSLGNTGNVLNFQSGQTAVNNGFTNTSNIGVSNNIGGNFFSDRFGAPTSNAVLPQLGGSTLPGGDSLSDIPGGSDDTITGTATGSAGTADFGDLSDDAFDGSTGAVGGTATSASGIPGVGGASVNITDLPGADTAITGAGTAVQQGATTAGGDILTGTGNIASTAASAINSLESYTSTTFVAVAIAIMGIIFVAFGLGLFGKKQVQQVVQTAAPVVRAARLL
jgi:Cell Wall Hydrolase